MMAQGHWGTLMRQIASLSLQMAAVAFLGFLAVDRFLMPSVTISPLSVRENSTFASIFDGKPKQRDAREDAEDAAVQRKSDERFHRSGGDPKFALAMYGGRLDERQPTGAMFSYCIGKLPRDPEDDGNYNELARKLMTKEQHSTFMKRNRFIADREHQTVVRVLDCESGERLERFCNAQHRADLLNMYAYYEDARRTALGLDPERVSFGPDPADPDQDWNGPQDRAVFRNLQALLEKGYLQPSDFGKNAGPQVKAVLATFNASRNLSKEAAKPCAGK
jgi:hypothetical protein